MKFIGPSLIMSLTGLLLIYRMSVLVFVFVFVFVFSKMKDEVYRTESHYVPDQ